MTLGTSKVVGTIPAHAGETSTNARDASPAWDDPRARGGNSVCNKKSTHRMGRSPRTRGKRDLNTRSGLTNGTIPAHAGETSPYRKVLATRWDDPRARGGNVAWYRALPMIMGRSPRTRGKRRLCHGGGVEPGTIPAHAGETCLLISTNPEERDDPRARGGNNRDSKSPPSPLGRSPRTRGKPHARRRGATTERDDPRARGGNKMQFSS